MSVVVELDVTGIDLEDDDTIAVIGAHLTDALWAQTDGAVTATLDVDAHDVVGAVIEWARRVVDRIHGASVTRVRRDLVSASDIAHRIGVSREAVRKWANAGAGFPTPVATLGGADRATRVWLWPDVATWLVDTGRGAAIDRNWPTHGDVVAIEAALFEGAGAVPQGWRLPTELECELRTTVHYVPRVPIVRVVRVPSAHSATSASGRAFDV